MQELNGEIFRRLINEADSICILGHVNPDGDCIGSTLAVYNYILAARKGDEPEVRVYLEKANDKFAYMNGFDSISDNHADGRSYGLAIVCDCADINRIGKFAGYLKTAGVSVLIDHHYTNAGFGDYGLVVGDASSACEVLYGLMDKILLNRDIAECIYTGIAHDTGVFRYSSTSPYTMEIAARCMSKGIDFNFIIDHSFFSMTYDQKIVLGYVLGHAEKKAGGKLIFSYLDMDTRRLFHAEEMDMDGMIDQLRTTDGAAAAAFLYETKDRRVKASLRSNTDQVDVSVIAVKYGGGGHKKAAGCFMPRDFKADAADIEAEVLRQLNI